MKAGIVTLPGYYIGPEITAQAVKALEAVAAKYGHCLLYPSRHRNWRRILRAYVL